MMQLHQLKPVHRRKTRKRIGRGGKKGMSSGFGVGKMGMKQPRIREVLKRYPKLKGYRVKKLYSPREVVNLKTLENKFENGAIINPRTLAEKKIIRTIQGSVPEIKILGAGELTKAFTIDHCKISKSAREKIEKAGGIVQ